MHARPRSVHAALAIIVTAGALAASIAPSGAATKKPATTKPKATTTRPAPTTTGAPTTAAPTSPPTTIDRGKNPAPEGVPAGMGSKEPDGVFPRNVTHFGGTTNVSRSPRRVVIIATGQLDGILTLGVVPLGAAAGEGAGLVPDYLAKAFPQYKSGLDKMASVGARLDPNLEKIASLQPDLILANKAGSGAIYDRLNIIAPTVLTEGTGVNWKQDFLLIAAALGKTGQAQKLLNDFKAEAATIGVKAKSPSVSMTRFNAGRTRIFGVPSFGGSIAWDAGLTRPKGQQFDATSQDISEELMPLIDADWLFYSVQGDPAKTNISSFVNSGLWKNLGVVKANHVVVVDDDPWYLNAGPTAALVVLDGLRDALVKG